MKEAYDGCRAAMLQGNYRDLSQPVDPQVAEYEEIMNQAGNSPVTPGSSKLPPQQPLIIDSSGTLRFRENQIVRKLLDYATERGYGLNEIAREEFEAEDQMQLAQLIGYSLDGYGMLSYVTDESYERAAAVQPQQEG